jgi:hypothetical protein
LRRVKILDKYFKVKRRSVALTMLMKQYYAYKAYKNLLLAVEEAKMIRKMKLAGFKISLKLFVKCGKPMRKAGGLEKHLKNKSRYLFQIEALMQRN